MRHTLFLRPKIYEKLTVVTFYVANNPLMSVSLALRNERTTTHVSAWWPVALEATNTESALHSTAEKFATELRLPLKRSNATVPTSGLGTCTTEGCDTGRACRIQWGLLPRGGDSVPTPSWSHVYLPRFSIRIGPKSPGYPACEHTFDSRPFDANLLKHRYQGDLRSS